MSELNATCKSGDVWTGEKSGDWFMYQDQSGNLYESKEQPAYRISMDNAGLGESGIEPLKPL